MGVFRIWRWIFRLFGLGFLVGRGCTCGRDCNCGRPQVDPERRHAFFGKLHEALDVLEREGAAPSGAGSAGTAPGEDPLSD